MLAGLLSLSTFTIPEHWKKQKQGGKNNKKEEKRPYSIIQLKKKVNCYYSQSLNIISNTLYH